MPWGVQAAMSVLVRGMDNFVMVTPEQFLFGYDDALVTLANIANTLLHINWPAPRIMSLLKGVRTCSCAQPGAAWCTGQQAAGQVGSQPLLPPPL